VQRFDKDRRRYQYRYSRPDHSRKCHPRHRRLRRVLLARARETVDDKPRRSSDGNPCAQTHDEHSAPRLLPKEEQGELHENGSQQSSRSGETIIALCSRFIAARLRPVLLKHLNR